MPADPVGLFDLRGVFVNCTIMRHQLLWIILVFPPFAESVSSSSRFSTWQTHSALATLVPNSANPIDVLAPLAVPDTFFTFTPPPALLQSRLNNTRAWSAITDLALIFNFSTTGLPEWLAFFPTNFTFAGTPPLPTSSSSSSSTTHVTLTAKPLNQSVALGSTLTSIYLAFTFKISTLQRTGELRASPSLKLPLLAQLNDSPPAADLSSGYLLPSGHGVHIPPSWSFSIGFQYSTCTLPPSSSGTVHYSASIAGGIPLPSWLKFSPNDVTFTGSTPSKTIQPQSVNVTMSCSRTAGVLGDVSDWFLLVVGDRALEVASPITINNGTEIDFDGTMSKVETSPGENVRFELANLESLIAVDGMTILEQSDLRLALDVETDLSTVPWLSWDR